MNQRVEEEVEKVQEIIGCNDWLLFLWEMALLMVIPLANCTIKQ
jgi:hypothetical protein